MIQPSSGALRQDDLLVYSLCFCYINITSLQTNVLRFMLNCYLHRFFTERVTSVVYITGSVDLVNSLYGIQLSITIKPKNNFK